MRWPGGPPPLSPTPPPLLLPPNSKLTQIFVLVMAAGTGSGSTAGPGRPQQRCQSCTDAESGGKNRRPHLQCGGHGLPPGLHQAGLRVPTWDQPLWPFLPVPTAGSQAGKTGQRPMCVCACMTTCASSSMIIADHHPPMCPCMHACMHACVRARAS